MLSGKIQWNQRQTLWAVELDYLIDFEGQAQRKNSQCKFEDLIRGLLAFNAAKRMSALETLKNE
jgi:hypothetical protein